MEYISNSPMMAVEDVSLELQRLSSVCNVLSMAGESGLNAKMEDICNIMRVLRDCLDIQINALDGIQWAQQKVAGA